MPRACLGGKPAHRSAHDPFDDQPYDRRHVPLRLKLDSPCELRTCTARFQHEGASVIAHWRTRKQRVAQPTFRLEGCDLFTDRAAPRSDRSYLSDTTGDSIAWLFDNNGSYTRPSRHGRRVDEEVPHDRRRCPKLFSESQGDHVRAV